MLSIFSRNIRKIPHLEVFLGDSFQWSLDQGIVAIAGWGHKPTADKARRIAKEKNLSYIALEDGFYRSLDLGCKGATPLSLVVDRAGIYYDATQESDLENLLNSTRWEHTKGERKSRDDEGKGFEIREGEGKKYENGDNKNREHESQKNEEWEQKNRKNKELLKSARCAIDTIITHNLSKYNHAPLAPNNFFDNLMQVSCDRQSVFIEHAVSESASEKMPTDTAYSYNSMQNKKISDTFTIEKTILETITCDALAHKKCAKDKPTFGKIICHKLVDGNVVCNSVTSEKAISDKPICANIAPSDVSCEKSTCDDVISHKSKPRILILDQTRGDASISLGLATKKSFINMLDEAMHLYPATFIAIKTHPDVLAGKKKGYLTEEAKKRNIPLIAQDFAPISLLKQVDIVFTVTSQMGFEGLLLGKEVHCFGMPFYAGWGLTHDRLLCSRRVKKRSIEELFAASCMLYARYVNPVSGERTDIHEILRLLIIQRKHNETNRGFHACVGFSRWKHIHARAYLQGTASRIRFYRNESKAVLAAKRNQGNVVAWSSKIADYLILLCQTHNVPLVRMEDGFIRSVGLGSDFNWPYSLVLDEAGMYYDPSMPSDLENILNDIQNHIQHDTFCEEANVLRNLILEKGLTKYNVGNASNSVILKQLPKDKRIILVPGQVEDDASVRTGGQGIESNLELLKKVYEKNPDAYIIYKPHPDVEKMNRKGSIADEKALEYANIIIRDEKMDILLKHVDEVHTLTSLTGFEALLRGLVVYTYGIPFYAGWGLTHDLHSCSRRRVSLTLNELIAGTLLLYPSYYDWNTKQFVSAKDICFRLLQPNGQRKGKLWACFINKLREFVRKVRV